MRRTKPGEPAEWLRQNVGYDGPECLMWPFGKNNGYPNHVKMDGRSEYGHRAMCRLVNGDPPNEEYEASHSCGRGHLGCVDPRHLAWKTAGENQADRANHGTRNVWGWRGKLTQAQADEIMALRGKMKQADIAKKFGVSRSNVSFIHCGQAWAKGCPRWDKTTAHTELQKRVVVALASAGRPMRTPEVREAADLRDENAASLLLSKLARRGLIVRVSRGRYQAVGQPQP